MHVKVTYMDDVTIYRDLAGRHVSDPEYDPHTLLVRADYFKRYAIKLEGQ